MVAIYILTFAGLIALMRIILGPTTIDRINGINTFITISIIIMTLLFMIFNDTMIIDIAFVLTILSFIGTLIFTTYMRIRYVK